MTEQEITIKLSEIFREVFADDNIQIFRQMSAIDVPGWDSMKMVTIILAVEERFGIRLTSREVDALREVGDFIDLIKARA